MLCAPLQSARAARRDDVASISGCDGSSSHLRRVDPFPDDNALHVTPLPFVWPLFYLQHVCLYPLLQDRLCTRLLVLLVYVEIELHGHRVTRPRLGTRICAHWLATLRGCPDQTLHCLRVFCADPIE